MEQTHYMSLGYCLSSLVTWLFERIFGSNSLTKWSIHKHSRYWVYNGEQDKVPGVVESALGWMISQARISLGLWQSWHTASWVSGGSVREASWG